MAPEGAVVGPFSTDVLPQIFAGGALGHDPFGAASVVVAVGDGLVVVGATAGAVVAGAVVAGAVVAGAVVAGAVVAGAVVAGAVVAGAVVAGAVVAGAVVAGAVVAGAVVAVAGAVVAGAVVAGAVVAGACGADAVVVGFGEGIVGAVPPLLATVKCPRRLEVWPSDHFRTALIVCDPSPSFVVSYGTAVPSAAVPARSKGAALSVRMCCFVSWGSSR
jgi:hypothetical protein